MTTPHQGSSEFAILIAKIIEELKQNEVENLETIKIVCSHLTVREDPHVLLFTEGQQETINACNNLQMLFTKNLRGCWRWDDFPLLKLLLQSLKCSDHCEVMLAQYEQKLDSQMKLQQIYEHCMQEDQEIPAGYEKMVAVVQNKLFSRITKEEYDELKRFISEHCGVKPYVIPPFYKAGRSSLYLEFIVPMTAVSHMIETASKNINKFQEASFVYLKIASILLFDITNTVSVDT